MSKTSNCIPGRFDDLSFADEPVGGRTRDRDAAQPARLAIGSESIGSSPGPITIGRAGQRRLHRPIPRDVVGMAMVSRISSGVNPSRSMNRTICCG